MILRCGSRARRSTRRCSCKPRRSCPASSPAACGADAFAVFRSAASTRPETTLRSRRRRRFARDRPTVLDRREPGHWEGDPLVGRYGRSHLVTLVERYSRYLLVLPIKNATTGTVITAVAEAFARLPDTMRTTLTWDRGVVMTRHLEFTDTTRIPVYFCDAYCSWQRGSNENTNGLLRQYLPEKTNLALPNSCGRSSTSSTHARARSSGGRFHTRSSRPRALPRSLEAALDTGQFSGVADRRDEKRMLWLRSLDHPLTF
jgi:hypothetical protein